MNTVVVEMGDKEKEIYDNLCDDMVVSLGDNEIDAVNAASLSNKLLQMANGAVYGEEQSVHHIHDEKLNALEDLIESANGKPVLVAYWFKHDLARIKAKFPFVRENLIVSAMEKYSLEHIFGMCGDWLRDVHHPEMTYTKSRAKVKKSGSAEKLSQEAKYIETFKAGGCTLGDTDMSRHRDVYYDNNFPCGHHCPHCGQFWVD
jgi:hypothetical protein